MDLTRERFVELFREALQMDDSPQIGDLIEFGLERGWTAPGDVLNGVRGWASRAQESRTALRQIGRIVQRVTPPPIGGGDCR